MSQTFYIIIAGFFLCLTGLFVEKNYLIASLVKKIPIEKEEKFAEKIIGETLKLDQNIIKDKTVIKKFKKITDKLVNSLPKSDYNYKIFIEKSPKVNAYAYPGGYIIITTGLIKFADKTEELLAVLAHEIAHVNKRHVLTSMVEQAGISGISALLFGNTEGVSHIAISGTTLLRYKFSREYEKEADLAAVEYLAKAKINPREFINFFNKLEKSESSNIEFLSTHPLTQSREEYIKNYIEKNNLPNFSPLQINYSEFKALF